MDSEDIGDWFLWGVLLLTFVVMALTAVMTLAAACREIYLHFATRRRNKQAPVPIEELLAGIPDVPYQELPADDDGGAAGGEGDGEESCVICAAPYEAGEPCSVLPPCTHVFHKACAAAWLRQSTTCPLCRAAVAMPAGHRKKEKARRPRRQGGEDVVSAAENMV
ncbi:hypothetical protein BS78_08G020300 [Paspalum vaginatum]|nr:hypothetical protein BS78_08G020300 [Paspalum vaginatum]